MPRDDKPHGAISIDVDPLDHYLGVRGFEPLAITRLNTMYQDALPRFLDLFEKLQIEATFFLVGKDSLDNKNKPIIRQMVFKGHEVANHTMNHIQAFLSLSQKERKEEIEEAQKRLEDITGHRILGFRAPGWNIDAYCLDLLEEKGYLYDSSVFASLLAPFIKAYYCLSSRGRMTCLGKPLWLALAPLKPYKPSKRFIWLRGKRNILELPVSMVPMMRLPFLGTMLFKFGFGPFWLSFWALRQSSQPLNYILHGLELVDYHKDVQDPRLLVKPGLGMSLEKKMQIYEKMLSAFKKHYQLVSLRQLAIKFLRREK